MERMLVVVFDNEGKAYQGRSTLRRLAADGSITVYADAVVAKHADGTASVRQEDDFGPAGTLMGTAVGSLIGLLGGPAGLALGAASGLTLGAMFDLDNARVGGDFVDDVSRSLTPNKVAVIAEVDEDWTTPVDAQMETLGGTVIRRALREVRKDQNDEELAAMKADLAQFREEMSKAHADRKAKLQSKVDQLQERIAARQKEAKQQLDTFEARQASKRALLAKHAAAAGRAIKELAKTPL